MPSVHDRDERLGPALFLWSLIGQQVNVSVHADGAVFDHVAVFVGNQEDSLWAQAVLLSVHMRMPRLLKLGTHSSGQTR